MLVTATVMAQVIMYGSYAMWLMTPYLTDVWDIGIVQAAAVVNLFDGIVAILPLGFKIILNSLGDSTIGDYYMLLWSGVSSTLGLLLVTMSTPSVFSKITGTCSEYEPKCISHTQKAIFYAGLVILATGMATCLTSLRPYIFERSKMMGIKKPKDIYSIRQALVQDNVKRETLVQRLEAAKSSFNPDVLRSRAYNWPSELWLYRCNGLFTVFLVVLVFWIKPWSLRLGIPTMILFASTFLFVLKPWYRVVSNGVPDNVAQIEQNSLFTKTMAKSLKKNFPVWSSFIICGLISSVGNTFFMEQAGQMEPNLGHWEVPTAFFLLFYKLVNLLTTWICQEIISPDTNNNTIHASNTKKTKHVITFALIVCIVCCVIAALVEKTRLVSLKRQGLVDNDSVAPLSMFVMIPQFLLLGILDGAYNIGVYAFFQLQFPKFVKKYLNSMIHFVLGLGILGNVLSVYMTREISGKGGHQSWFQHSLNQSRLDKYYWVLALISAANLLYYFFVAHCWSKCNKLEPQTGEPDMGSEEVEELEYERLDFFDLLPLRQ